MIKLKMKTFNSRSKMVLTAPALVLSYFGVYVSVENRIIKMRKSMTVQHMAMVRIRRNSFFFYGRTPRQYYIGGFHFF